MNGKHFIRVGVVLGISLLACAVALLVGRFSGRANDFFYDTFYRLRPVTDMRSSDIVLVAVDDAGLDASGKPWPWPRTMWGDICTYLDKAGAKVITFDIVFPNPSYYGDDNAFAAAMSQIKTPVIYGAAVQDDGGWQHFGPPIKEPVFGAVNLGTDVVYRAYPPELNGQSSLAEITAMKAGGDLKMVLDHPDQPFLLHYYGPHKRADGNTTFRFVNAFNVWYAQNNGAEGEKKAGVSPDLFKGKIVIVCAIARAAFDLKSSPLSGEYPGPEIQATAVENILRAQRVHVVSDRWLWLTTVLAALLVSAGVIYPRPTTVKIAAPIVAVAVVMALCVGIFRADVIQWMSPVLPLAAILASSPLAFGYTYFSEDRQRRFMLKALSKVVSPAVAEELSRNPERLALGTVRSDITILFTDVAGFTDLSEGMDVQDLGKFINRYLGEMSTRVFQQDGTLDKYIGDAVMAFWNAPIAQSDHAARACRAALTMVQREKELQTEFSSLGAGKVFTRIGIHTSPAAVGFIGSEHLFNYTAMGDGVNLASRMEGANKIYGTQILITETTAALVKEHFWLRRVDILRVKGKKVPMAVYEVMGVRSADEKMAERIRLWESALDAYMARQWDESERLLLEVLRWFGQDGPAEVLRERVTEFRKNPPPDNWDGVHVSKTK